MAKRRSKGDGGIRWFETRQRWIAEITVGYTASGKRKVKTATAGTKTWAEEKLKELIRDLDDGVPIADHAYTVGQAVEDWMTYGLSGRDEDTIKTYRYQVDRHINPHIGARKLRELAAEEVEKWLADRATVLSTRTLRMLHSILNRSVKRAMKRDKVKRNVVDLCDVPAGRDGRPSKALTFDQAIKVLQAAENADRRSNGRTASTDLGSPRFEWRQQRRTAGSTLHQRLAAPTPQLRLATVERQGPDRRHRTARRPQRHRCH
ncbi:hypothetical protein FHX82_001163 [Amycolatopsis bartoniae]|uniref:hypothetical protein n=1 Tax=Amycolatopsis bartoniae TaxID=941986 RepID=UPI0017F89C11|nr:hypothetical protein [Amycolatopsis bartoniae]MBB2934143.1 hypothetical protein [Amycolatopsis bartoniae]